MSIPCLSAPFPAYCAPLHAPASPTLLTMTSLAWSIANALTLEFLERRHTSHMSPLSTITTKEETACSNVRDAEAGEVPGLGLGTGENWLAIFSERRQHLLSIVEVRDRESGVGKRGRGRVAFFKQQEKGSTQWRAK